MHRGAFSLQACSKIDPNTNVGTDSCCDLRPLMRLSVAPYRLLFKRPFGTAHGLRDGTDSVFVRLEHEGFTGYGEATLPPYLPQTQDQVLLELRRADLDEQISSFESGIEAEGLLSPPARAALSSAYYDLVSKQKGIAVSMLLRGERNSQAKTMVTLGHSKLEEIPVKLSELPASDILKIKLGSENDIETLRIVLEADKRPLFLDANQGWTKVLKAVDAVSVVGSARLYGLEQPFPKDRLDLQHELQASGVRRVFGDESIQDIADLERCAEFFGGVNVKLMKCGGLDRALGMIRRARDLGLAVMLGSMSESSLGSAAMFQLAGGADLLDLDGPWLIANDPFEGMEISGNRISVQGAAGMGVRPALAGRLAWFSVGA